MHIVAKHDISDPADFWKTIQQAAPKLPPSIRVAQVLASADGRKSVCLWEADSVETVRKLVNDAVGHCSSNEFFAADPSRSVGLPAPLPQPVR